ncbi:S1 RNA-binding domain-containing protein [Nanoarchaeota archaeon]
MIDIKEFPDEGDLILCTVKQIQGTTVFVELDKYKKTGVIHTSEIAPGRIRNIREYVVPNKKIVCKVLRLDRAKGHIDLSLRRVSKKDTQEEIKKFKREKVSEKILEMVLKDKAIKVREDILKKFPTVSEFLETSLQNPELLNEHMGKEEAEKLSKIVSEKIKSKDIFVKATLKVSSTDSEGVNLIKNALNIKEEGMKITYLGAPNYMITIKGKDYKTSSKKLREVIEKIEKSLKGKKAEVEVIEE